MQKVSRYHPVMVALHWALAVLIVAALTLGALVMVRIPNTSPMKIEALRSHMIGGVLILLLMSLQFITRQVTALPAPAPTGNSVLDRLAWLSHRAFYVFVVAQAVTGLTMAVQAHLPQILLLGETGQIPATFWIFPARGLHYLFSRALMALIALHLAGVGYHSFIRRDHLLRRLWFGKRWPEQLEARLSQADPVSE